MPQSTLHQLCHIAGGAHLYSDECLSSGCISFLAEAKLSVLERGLLSAFKTVSPSTQISVAPGATLLKAALCCKSSP